MNFRLGFSQSKFLRSLFLIALAIVLGLAELAFDNDPLGPFRLAWFISENHPQPVTVVVATIVFSLFFSISGRLKFSFILTFLAFAMIAIGSFNKLYYLGVPLTAADVYFFFSDPYANFSLFLNYPMLGVVALSFLTISIFVGVRLIRAERVRHNRSRLVACLLALVTGVAYGYESSSAKGEGYYLLDEIQVGREAFRAYSGNMDQARRFESKSIFDLIEIFFRKSSIEFELPPKSSNGFIGLVESDAGQFSKKLPDIVSVLNESLFNPELLAACDSAPALCQFDMFKGSSGYPMEQGPLFVHTHGGGTWLSEFAFLSGYDWRTFGEGGAYAPKSIAPRLQSSLVTHLKSLGYRTIAIYPVAGNFLNAREAYKHYGFDEFYAVEELGIESDWQSTSDAVVFKKSMQVLAQHHDERPVFVFILTIKNHGPHATRVNEIAALAPDLKEMQVNLPVPLVDYINRMRETNEAISLFRNQWLKSDRPRVFSWFGDHQPLFTKSLDLSSRFSLPGAGTDGALKRFRFLTWYEISSNIPEGKIINAPVVTDLAFLGTKILKYAQLPLPPHGDVTLRFADECPLGSALCGNRGLVNDYLSYRVWDLNEIRQGY